jgi:hypothetical protein
MSGVILVQGFSVTNSLYPDQEKRTMREPEGPNPEVGMKRACASTSGARMLQVDPGP